MHFQDYVFAAPYFSWLLRGIVYTILYFIISLVVSFAIALFFHYLAFLSERKKTFLADFYVTIFQNIPPLPLLLLLVFGLPGIYKQVFAKTLPPDLVYILFILGLSLNCAAYMIKIMQTGLNSIPSEFFYLQKILGIAKTTCFFKVILPQELMINFPSLGTRIIHNLKNCSIAVVLPFNVNYMEIIGQSGRIAGQTFAWAEPLVFAVVFYVGINLGIKFLFNHYGKLFHLQVSEIK